MNSSCTNSNNNISINIPQRKEFWYYTKEDPWAPMNRHIRDALRMAFKERLCNNNLKNDIHSDYIEIIYVTMTLPHFPSIDADPLLVLQTLSVCMHA